MSEKSRKSTADAAIDRGKEKFPIYETVKNKLVETLSYGQKRIISLMSAVVTGAKCVIFILTLSAISHIQERQATRM